MKRFVCSTTALFGAFVCTLAIAETPTETQMPGSWGNIPISETPTEQTTPDVEDKQNWDNIPISGEKSTSNSINDGVNWNEIQDSIPTAAALPPKSREGLAFSASQNKNDKDLDDVADPHNKSRTWLAHPPTVQVEREAQLRTVMGGGIFVPTMSGGLSEPKYQVYDASGKVVSEAATGTTSYVPAGHYTVHVGTPVTRDNLEFDVNVVEGNTTLIPVEWSGLIVKVVNDRGTTIRGNYEIVSLPERSYIGLGTGALINEGERLNTWLLWPGQYMIISAGEGYQARKNFITIDLDPGELSRVTLVLDEDTGDIMGGGEIEVIEDEPLERWWWAGVLIGGSIRFNHTKDVVGKAPGQLLDVSAFLESYFSLAKYSHYLYTRLNAEIGGTIRFEENRPFITTVDELYFELLYSYRLVDWFGPFVRFAFESNMAPSYQEKNTPYTIEKLNKNGDVVASIPDQLDIKLSPPFSPITINTGVGGRFDVTLGSWMKFSSRIGIAYRKVIARDLYVALSTDNETSTIRLLPVSDNAQFGAEAAITLDLTPLRWFTLKTDLSLIEPFDDYKNPVVDLDIDAAIRLSSIASLSYTLRLNYDVSLINAVQIDQYVQLRFSYKLY